MLHCCEGYELFLSGNYHSLWSNQKICLVVHEGSLKRIHEDWSVSTLLAVDPWAKMAYVDVDGVVYFTNNIIIGYIESGISYPFPEPNQQFKKRMIGGQLLEYFNARLYAAQGANIFFSDSFWFTRMDVASRTNNGVPIGGNWIAMPDWVSMMKAVSDGMYVGSGKAVYFLGGLDPFVFSRTQVTGSAPKPGSAITIEGEDVGKGFSGRVVVWSSEEGVFMGFPGGMVKELTEGNYSLEEGIDDGAALFREDGFSQYLYNWRFASGYGGAEAEIRIPPFSVEGQLI